MSSMDGEDDEGAPVPVAGMADPLDLVRSLLAVGQRARALQLATEGVARDPSDPWAHTTLAYTLLWTHRTEAALAAADDALRLAPEAWSPRFVRGSALAELGRFAEAERELQALLTARPGDVAALSRLGALYAVAGLPAAALPYVEEAMSITPDDARLHAQRVGLLLQVPAESWRQTVESARAAVALNPSDNFSLAVLAAVLLARGELDEAEDLVRRVLRRDAAHALASSVLMDIAVYRSPLLRPMLWWSRVMMRRTPGQRLALVSTTWAAGRILELGLTSVGATGAATAWSVLWLAFCVYTWFADPITRWVLRRRFPWLRG